MKTPRHRRTLLVAVIGAFASLPVAAYVWLARHKPEIYADTPPSADSIGLVIGGVSLYSGLAAVAAVAMLGLLARRYPGAVPLFVQTGDRRISLPGCALAFVAAVVAAATSVVIIEASFEFVPAGLLLLYVVLCARAARAADDGAE